MSDGSAIEGIGSVLGLGRRKRAHVPVCRAALALRASVSTEPSNLPARTERKGPAPALKVLGRHPNKSLQICPCAGGEPGR